ncbi:hypothetical protein BABA_08426 [Neobacillus bataviensis LMG 21833]|uniref:DUF4362 domain-containing protein n=1 Tax=Neobacillus bataviensis LMG 21833 TaxID=1117379 RepID=K6DNQ1_9BACI|nr:DUF4362 domain-containing protein [Neobacillus bataviensis]EKN69803.1 hypothetical protein BABA_08426 [Neobacillus bataviensis LMG 21833]
MLKRTYLIVFIIVFCTFITGCQLDKAHSDDYPKKPTENEVVNIHGGLENIERLDLFVKNTQNGKKDKVRLTQYTIEGDPIFQDLEYDGDKVAIKIDSTKDKFGGGEVRSYVCKGIQKQESNTETKYLLEECPDISDLVTISHDVGNQDYFAFELKYGAGLKNKINTKSQEVIKDLKNGKTVAISDFQFSKEELNQIYKQMILSNYLGDKKLSTKCNKKSYESYDLTIWINDGGRHFKWSECDKSTDGRKMTNLVNNILEILKNNTTYQSLSDS